MTTALAPAMPDLVAQWKANPELIATVRAAVFPGATDAELALYFHECARNNVHPMDRMIFPQVRTNQDTGQRRVVFVTSIDLFRSRASDTGEHAGTDDVVFEGTTANGQYPLLASVTAYRFVHGEKCAFTATARWGEYYPGDGKAGAMWRKMPHTMLGKCVEGLALRKGFPRTLSGLYVREEMDQAEGDAVAPERMREKQERALVDRAAARKREEEAAADKEKAIAVVVDGVIDAGRAIEMQTTRFLSLLVTLHWLPSMPPTGTKRNAWFKQHGPTVKEKVNMILTALARKTVETWAEVSATQLDEICGWLEVKYAKELGAQSVAVETPTGAPADPMPAAAAPEVAPPPAEEEEAETLRDEPDGPPPSQVDQVAEDETGEALMTLCEQCKFASKGARRFYSRDPKSGRPYFEDGVVLTEIGLVGKNGVPVSVWFDKLNPAQRREIAKALIRIREGA